MHNTQLKTKSFWERPEGTTGMVCATLLGIAGIYGFIQVLPRLLRLLEDTLYLALLAGALFGLCWLLLDRRFWTLLGYGYRGAMRFITGLFIQIDPIAILRSYTEDLRAALVRMDKQIAILRGQMRQLQETMDSNANEMGKAMQVADMAKQQQKSGMVLLKSRQAGRLRDSNLTLQALHSKMEALYRVLVKMHESSSLLVEDIEAEVDVKRRERAAIQASHSAFRQAMKIIRGDGDKKALFDQTLDYLAEDYGQKLGEIEHFVTMSASFIDSVDLQNGVYEEEALRMLDQWQQRDVTPSSAVGQALASSHDAPVRRNAGTASDNYRKLFGDTQH